MNKRLLCFDNFSVNVVLVAVFKVALSRYIEQSVVNWIRNHENYLRYPKITQGLIPSVGGVF